MRLTKNFLLSEFNSKDGAEMPPKVEANILILADNLQVIRDHIKTPIKINSGYRSPEHNKRIGGVKNSQHTKGKAADLKVETMTTKELYNKIENLIKENKILQGGLGLYSTFVHYDIRGKKARWKG